MIRGSDVTVVTPTILGREDFVARAMASVAAQQVAPATTVLQIDRRRNGAAWCRNQALTQVDTDWLAWLDDDDELLPNHIKVLTRAANRSGADMVYSNAEFVGGRDPLAVCQNRQLIPSPINVPFGPDQRDHLDSRRSEYCPHCGYLRGNYIPVTYLVRTDLVRAVGGMPEPYAIGQYTSAECEDYGLLLRMLDAGATFHHVLGAKTWRYHFHDQNTGGRGRDRMHELAASDSVRPTSDTEGNEHDRHESPQEPFHVSPAE